MSCNDLAEEERAGSFTLTLFLRGKETKNQRKSRDHFPSITYQYCRYQAYIEALKNNSVFPRTITIGLEFLQLFSIVQITEEIMTRN